jgi:flagellar basal body-associated protein FliL
MARKKKGFKNIRRDESGTQNHGRPKNPKPTLIRTDKIRTRLAANRAELSRLALIQVKLQHGDKPPCPNISNQMAEVNKAILGLQAALSEASTSSTKG